MKYKNETDNMRDSKEMYQIINEYEQQNDIKHITEEEIICLFGESALFPILYLPAGGRDYYDCIEISDYDSYLLNIGFNPFEEESPEWLERFWQTEDGIDLGDADYVNQDEYERELQQEISAKLFAMRTEIVDVYVTDAEEAIRWYRSELEDNTLQLRVHSDAGDDKFLILVTHAEYFYLYGIYLEFEYEENGHMKNLGTCTDADDVHTIIMYYIHTGKAYGHR
jgi:hypothetical protein